MISNSRSLLLAATLFVAPLGTAMAQNNPSGNLGSNKSATAAPGTADSKTQSGMNTADVHSTTPGSTGRAVVPGSGSTQGGTAAATADQKTGATTGGAK